MINICCLKCPNGKFGEQIPVDYSIISADAIEWE